MIYFNIDLSSLHIEESVSIQASPSRVWEALVDKFSDWWGYPLLVDQKRATAVILEPRLGGLLRESWDGGGGAVFGMVTRLDKDRLLSIQGYMGLAGPLSGVIEFELIPESSESTLVKVSHRAFGVFDWQTEPHYRSGWQDVLRVRLKRMAETGTPTPFRPLI